MVIEQVFIIPVLIGLLFELLVIVPMRVPVDESPVFLLYQDWALGLIFLKIWTRLVSNFLQQSATYFRRRRYFVTKKQRQWTGNAGSYASNSG